MEKLIFVFQAVEKGEQVSWEISQVGTDQGGVPDK